MPFVAVETLSRGASSSPRLWRKAEDCGIGAGSAAFIEDLAAAFMADESCKRFATAPRMNCTCYR